MPRSIAERYRSTRLEDFQGNAKAVAAVRFLLRQGIGGQALWISGATGIGKTTLARIIAAELADPWNVAEYDSADQVTAAELDRLEPLGQYGLGSRTGRVVIINEAHGLRGPIMRRLLGLLERLPDHVTFIFTTTRDGQSLLFDDIDGRPLVDRCKRIPLTTQGLAEPFAARLMRVAALEGFRIPPTKAREVLKDANNSLRAALEFLGSPQSMAYLASPGADDSAAAVAA